MKRLLAALLVTALPAWSASSAPGCGNLCGRWQLEAPRSDAAAPALDAALAKYSEPRDKRSRSRPQQDAASQIEAEMEHSLGPIHDRLGRTDLRAELLTLLTAPQLLVVDSRGTDIVIRGDGNPERKFSPGVPRARVDAVGTAKINSSLKADRLLVTEVYDRKRKYSETYVLQRADGTLLVTREVQRPGMKPLRIRTVYRRA
jgi:hypothetical protein